MQRLKTLDIASERPHLVLDIETTGQDPEKDRIVSVGALMFPDGIFGEKPHTRYQWFFNPEPVRSTDEAYDVHRLTPDFLKQHDAFDQFNQHVKDLHGLMFHYPFTGGCPVIIAHSAEFDLAFLKQAFDRIGFWYPEDKIRYYCTKLWAADGGLLCRLDSQLASWGLPTRTGTHDSLHDAWMAAQVAFRQGLQSEYGIYEAKKRELPPAFDQSPYKRKILIRCPDSVSDDVGEVEPGDDVETILAARNSTHGDFSNNSEIADAMMNVLALGDAWRDMSPDERVALFYIVGKISRYCSAPLLDTLDDIEGYARLARKAAVQRGVK